jgi:pimeloyl-ACP methyl ester carboxylesterase
MTQTTTFKTPDGEAAYMAVYEAAMKSWPVPYEELEIPTQFGTTYVVVSGPQQAPALVLLHGYLATLTMWVPNIADLSKHYRVYAIDVMGQPGKSIPNPDDPIRDLADFDAWLGVTLDALHLEEIYLAGMSYGGWLALHFAMTAPERVRKLVLMSPGAGFLPLVKQFLLRGMLMSLIPTRFTVNSFMGWMGFEDTSEGSGTQHFLELFYLGMKHFQMPPETARVFPDVFSDEELSRLKVPVLLLIGENEVIYDPAEALARARQLIPNFEGELVPGCNHDMSASQYKIVDARVLEFLNDIDA